MNNLQSIPYFYPELILVATALIAIIVELVTKRKKSIRVGQWVFAGLVLTLIFQLSSPDQTITTLFMNSIALDPFSGFFKILFLISALFIILISIRSSELKSYNMGEYYVLITILVLGLFLMATAIDLITAYLAIEIVSIMSFILAGYLKKNPLSSESSLKYVIYGAFSSGLMLFGFSILFGLTGSTKYFEIQPALQQLNGSADLAVLIAIIFIFAGFGYKISAVPFHFWTPDVYQGAPTPITAFLSVGPKAAGFALIIRFVHDVLSDGQMLQASQWISHTDLPWPQLLAGLAVITMTMGNLVALQQHNIKRMLAYSSIAHAGYMLMVLPTLTGEGVYAIMIYLVMYLLMNLGAFFVVIAVKNRTNGETFEDFAGLGWKMPLIGLVMTVFMFSLTGLPPTAGFIGKFYLFAAVIKAGPDFYWLAFIGVINSVISLFYYLKVVKVMYFEGTRAESIVFPSPTMTWLLIALAVPTVVFGVYWAPVADWVRDSLLFFVSL